jgi:hypothetical protein
MLFVGSEYIGRAYLLHAYFDQEGDLLVLFILQANDCIAHNI